MELFGDEELRAGARNAQDLADTLPAALAEPLHMVTGTPLTELAHRRLAQLEDAP